MSGLLHLLRPATQMKLLNNTRVVGEILNNTRGALKEWARLKPDFSALKGDEASPERLGISANTHRVAVALSHSEACSKEV